MSNETDPAAPAADTTSIAVTYEKSPAFRTIHADGVFGGATPRGMIHMALFNERVPIPQTTSHELFGGTIMGKEIMADRDGKKGLFREIDVNVVLDLNTAKILRSWLAEHIVKLEAALAMRDGKGRVADEKADGDEH